ncbi:MAG: DUF4124 domain-containing protein [Pseudomonadota bacterium]|nr:DUF4124 domain-containing protein [Pseudomonadota bacterium]
MTPKHLPILVLSLLGVSTATAETVYKSIDPEGNVSYSSTPPPSSSGDVVEEVPIAPGPTQEQRQEAEQRLDDLEAASARADEQRQEREKERSQAAADAEQGLEKARMALEEAKIQRDDDWQYLATGGRVLKESYLDRVESAEQLVREAEQALQNARSGRR